MQVARKVIKKPQTNHRKIIHRGIKHLTLENSPPVHNLEDLLRIGKIIKFYKNIDMLMLWRIVPVLEELQNMIGMLSLKKTIFSQIIYYLQGMHLRNQGKEYLHTVIYGPPGCGKTTVGKILGELYKGLGILSETGEFRVAYRDDFISGYLGQTATKTKKLLNSCIGGTLFIDEVYSLGPRDKEKDSFAKEAIDTLNGFLSEHKDFCCIIAGYEDEVENCFFAMNRGLERRFPWIHRIEEYSSQELGQIFLSMIRKNNWELTKEITPAWITQFFDQNKNMFQNAGGDIETFLTKCKIFHSERVFNLSKDQRFFLTKNDIETALKYIQNYKKIPEKPPEHMYT